jgi:dihydrofolate reductase
MAATPEQAIEHARKAGCKSVMLAGGSRVSSDFLRAGLVNELYITFEPMVFGRGTPLLAPKELAVKLALRSVERLNPGGTLLARYTVISA